LKFNRKKFVYLISPNKIEKSFYEDLDNIFKSNKVSFFQLRLKNSSSRKKVFIGKKVKKICRKYKIKFLINDDVFLAKYLNADGCHLGQKDMKIFEARKILKKKIIGMTCHNSLRLAKSAIKNNVDYLALGSFYKSKTKKTKFKAKIDLLNKLVKITKKPIVAIGGINSTNYKKLLLNKANFLAISGYIWNNKRLKPTEAIKRFK
tara:strand:- start:565 stop:1179 length:615 start_codon:yes stop_codon:yes gene_type:complete